MTTLVRTWTASMNTAATTSSLTAQAREILRKYKDAIKLAGWTCEGSSSSTASGMDGTDRWAADSNLVWNSGGSAHSWIVLKSPTNYPSTGKNIYLLIACSTASGTPHLINMTVSPAAFTGGSTTADPTSAGSTRSYTSQQFIRTPVTTHKYSYVYNTTGDFLCWGAKTGAGYAPFAMGSFLLTGGEVGDLYPWMGFARWNDGTPGALIGSIFEHDSDATYYDNSDATSSGRAAVPSVNGSNLLAYVTNTGSGISGKYLDFPITLFDTAMVAIRGSMVDLAWAPHGSGIVQGTTEPSSGPPYTHALIGQLWVPINSSTIPTF